MKKVLKLSATLILLFVMGVIGVLLTNVLIERNVADKVYNSTKDIPANKVGLLLGTIKILPNGNVNLYYKYRINAALELYKAGKIRYVLVSGDNGRTEYDEPTTIKNDLIAGGIPESKIFLDYAGFRTLDSVIRSKEIFGQESITCISQQFHNERAIFIAKNKGINAIGYNAKDVSYRYDKKTKFREKLARVKMVLDLIVGKQPKFLGEKVLIG